MSKQTSPTVYGFAKIGYAFITVALLVILAFSAAFMINQPPPVPNRYPHGRPIVFLDPAVHE